MTSHRSMAQIRSLGTPQSDERVLWEGKPDMATLARSVFHTRAVGAYFLLLAAIAMGMGSFGGGLLTLAAGAATLGLLYGFAWLAARTSTYVLTDRRLILNIGMAIEKSINLPLKRIGAAHLTERGAGIGDIAIEPAEGHGLGYAILWPHARPFRFAQPQPMLRAVPNVAELARILTRAVQAHQEIVVGESPARPAPAAADAGIKEAMA